MVRLQRTPQMAGFTLLEIMVALAIFATLATAVLSASQYVLKQSVAVEERLFAAWVADNQLNELRLQSAPADGQSQYAVHMAGRDWLLRERISATPEPRLQKVEMEVSLANRDQPLHRASGWILNSDE
ncbi:type II secretion system minor pseudopilin GspI [Pseudomonas sp. MAG733B]|uniref:type II secretion system minor pseudopilin GspI n=1 Tax=Pseudomonas sp. MAG733B TaxID=3122079 RepID=UPI000FB78C18